MTRFLNTITVIALVGCSSNSAPKNVAPPPSPPLPPVKPAVTTRASADVEMLRALAVLATRHEPSAAELDATARAIASGQKTLDGYIDGLVASKEFSEQVAPLAILRQFLTLSPDGLPIAKVLNKVDGPTPLYYLTEKPCAASDAVRVHPWWNLTSDVLVCRDAYLPDKWTTEPYPKLEIIGGECLSQVGGASPLCGCGPNLIRCYESEAQQDRVLQSLRNELRDTIAWVVSNDMPAETIFTSNSTFRDRNAEFQRRLDILQERREGKTEAALQDLAAWPETGKWAPREDTAPGQHAGLLTAPMLNQQQLDRRQRMAIFYDILWCKQQNSAGASPEAMISIKGNNLQSDSQGWKELAQRPLCTNCHARLDYGLQFFWGYPYSYIHASFSPALQQKDKGELYGDSHDDLRGTADLNPHGFAELAVAQPEFRTCMAQDLAGYVLGNHLTPARLQKVLSGVKPNATSVRGLMRASLHALVEDWGNHPPVASSLASTQPPDAGADVAVTPALSGLLQTHCLDCHDADPDRIDLSKKQLSRTTVTKMLADVAFGRMPENNALPDDQRRTFIDAFVAATWAGADARTARDYFENRMQALPAYRPELVYDLIHSKTGADSPAIRTFEAFIRWDLQQVTPSVGVFSGIAAIEACRTAKKDRPRSEIDRCIEDSIRLDSMAIDPPARVGQPTPTK